MGAQARARELFSKFLFEVEDATSGFTTSKFQKGSGLETTVGIGEYAEGGAFVNMKEPGRLTISNFTLERGVSEDESFYQWCLEVCDFLAHQPEGAGLLTKNLLRDLTVLQKDRTQVTRVEWPMKSAFPARWNPSDWDNTVDDVQIEELELAIWWYDRETQ
jgi:phage tail-like protein